ncbi:helix-turn-helix domain-containing protein [Lactobacillus sp. S2-2]|uniref:helix-turn-helix domain-containing protein n=1 Tax=Lactobacillus sp. S2-2 TaxID=2692917 RepID=UPI001F29A7B8|nr:helix-turn-helix transcriptional regulator [Lactobacillus sp. S2-2]MCF6515524.1 helix-turn-helix domain-containing protein [Lactobacillus sp. S2-2]
MENNFKNENLNFGPQLKEIRNKQGFSVRQVSLQSDLSASYWSQVENKKREIPTAKTLAKMAKGLRVNENEIFELAGLRNEDETPEWATSHDKLELDKFLESNGDMSYRGVDLNQDQKERVDQILKQVFWEELEKEKKKDNNNE